MAQDIIANIKEKYQGKKILVVGLGLQGGGVGIAKFFSELGARVTVTDKKTAVQLADSVADLEKYPIELHLGGHVLEDFEATDVIFKGPSVPWTMPEIAAADKKGIPVEMELSFFCANFPGKVIGVTGTRGKSTTTRMIYDLLKAGSYPATLAGGLPGISTINFLKTLGERDWVVMEISSWALSGFHRKKISPHIGVLTNIYPDHLNYYKTMDDYLFDKKAIYLYQKKGDNLVINESLIDSLGNGLKLLPTNVTTFSKKDFPYRLNYLSGEHNLENAAAALKVSQILRIESSLAAKTISDFHGLPFRQEIVGKTNGTIIVNDTTSTTPVATIASLDSFRTRKIILILGGNSKNLPVEELLGKLSKVERIVLLAGSFTNQVMESLKTLYPQKISSKVYSDLGEAIKEGLSLAKQLDNSCLLFSPGATSFAMFDNEFHRGREFNRIVKQLLI